MYLAQFADTDYYYNNNCINKNQHPQPRRNGQNFQCEKCGKWYSTRSIMLRHMNHECGVEKKIICKLCLKRFRRKWNLEQHMKRVHQLSD